MTEQLVYDPRNALTSGRLTMTVPEAARLLGLSRSSAYEAARRAEIPTIRIGRRLLVPVPALLRLLAGESAPHGGSVPREPTSGSSGLPRQASTPKWRLQ